MTEPAAPWRPPELLVRTLVALGLIATALIAVLIGGWVFWLVVSLLALFMLGEWAQIVDASPRRRQLALLTLVVPLTIMSPAGAGPGFFALGLVFGAAFFVVIVSRLPWLAAGILYVGIPVLALLLIRRMPEYGLLYALWTLALVWMCDIGAYFAGRAFGGVRLAPVISPNKTWAGLVGGVVLASLFALFLHNMFGLAMRLTLATPVLALIAQGGDLFESWLKRRAGRKDSGTLFPGHGGVLDRLDGLVPVAPAAAFLAVVVPKLYGLL
ncbi:phosphatidate cytidylyltransferase [uncultured Sphingomonas sp.]|uniref:phosphatidate cytidylyltransferase n=1 Tax=uncultured Sphingomonas sp. TaxID=158754 RepID=UPI0035CA750C